MSEDDDPKYEPPTRDEIIDGHPVQYYKVKTMAGSGLIVNADYAQANCSMGQLPMFLIAARVLDWTPKFDGDGDLHKVIRLQPEEALPLTGKMKDQALIYMAHNGTDGVIDFPKSEDAEKLERALDQQDVLEGYLANHWADEVQPDETPAEMAVRLLQAARISPLADLADRLEDGRTVVGDSVATDEPNSWEEAGAESSREGWEDHVHGPIIELDDEEDLPVGPAADGPRGGPIFDVPVAV